jgi:hypothetical protein
MSDISEVPGPMEASLEEVQEQQVVLNRLATSITKLFIDGAADHDKVKGQLNFFHSAQHGAEAFAFWNQTNLVEAIVAYFEVRPSSPPPSSQARIISPPSLPS